MPTPTQRANRMIWALARQCRADDVAIVGVGTPIATAAVLLARAVLVPDLTVIVAASVDPRPHDLAGPMISADAVARLAVGTYSQADILVAIQRGRVTLQMISPVQVDWTGALNTSRVPTPDGTLRRLPGGLATADIAVLIGRLVAYRAEHSPRFLTDQVAFVTGVGHHRGQKWRHARGLPGAGVQSVVTDQALFRWTGDGFVLQERLGEMSVDEIAQSTGFALSTAEDVDVAGDIPVEARAVLDRVIDPHGVRTLEVREGRAQARDGLARAARNTHR